MTNQQYTDCLALFVDFGNSLDRGDEVLVNGEHRGSVIYFIRAGG